MIDDFIYNESEWPLLVITFPKREVNESDIENYLSHLYSYLQKKESVAVIIDIAKSSWLDAALRYKINNWVHENRVELRKYMKGTAYVVNGQLLRIALKAFLSFQDVSQVLKPIEVFSSVDKARKWAQLIIKQDSEVVELEVKQ
ncbi:MAG: hypothetical protein JSS79_06200 [Bacteroidetes bacterium]|nr:hypothetical protein [Bacteroidota bacterium]